MALLHYGNGLRILAPRELESKLHAANLYTDSSHGWTLEAQQSGILVDLSRVIWVEVGALVQLTLLIERAVKDHIETTVLMPYPEYFKNEDAKRKSDPTIGTFIDEEKRKRSAAVDFLKYLRFPEALQFEHLDGTLRRPFIEYNSSAYDLAFDSDSYTRTSEGRESNFRLASPYLYKYFFPLTWISPDDLQTCRMMARFLTKVISEPGRGLAILDADTLTNVIFYELLDNIRIHAEASHGLVAAWARPLDTSPVPSQYLESEESYLTWFLEISSSLVEIFIGDSGKGLVKELRNDFQNERRRSNLSPRFHINAETILWAFNRWSTSKPNRADLRGTRGLYRVDRIVRKYQGIVSIRTENQHAGYDHGGINHDKEIVCPTKLRFIPGTILSVRIPSHHAVPRIREAHIEDHDMHFELFDLGLLSNEGLDANTKSKLEEVFKRQSLDAVPSRSCVIGVASRWVGEPRRLEAALRALSEMRHPSAFVIYDLPMSWNIIEMAVNAVNEEHRKKKRDTESFAPRHIEIWDPVLVIGRDGQTTWVAAESYQRLILEHLVVQGSCEASYLDKLDIKRTAKTALMRYFRNEPSLVSIDTSGGLRARFTITSIKEGFHEIIKAQLSSHVLALIQEQETKKVCFRTPSLHRVKAWVSLQSLFSRISPDLIIGALTAVIPVQLLNILTSAVILSDNNASPECIDSLQRYLIIQRKEIMSQEASVPAGIRLVEAGAEVLVYADIISSGDSIRRCIRQVLRDGAKPIAALCIYDFRGTDTTLEVWGTEIPVISIVKMDLTPPPDWGAQNISPVTRQAEEHEKASLDSEYELTPPILKSLIAHQNALHFSHIGRPIGRHFTFYLDATRLISEDRIRDAFDTEITHWIGHDKNYTPHHAGEAIELWHPEPEPKPSSPARRFASAIKATRNDVQFVRAIRRQPAHGAWVFAQPFTSRVNNEHVVIIDWGALTGTTIMQMMRLAAHMQAKKILVCIFLSQLPQEEEHFLQMLSALKVHTYEAPKIPEQIPLLPKADAPPHSQLATLEWRPVDITVRFISRFLVQSYGQDCPVCQTLMRLASEIYPTPLLKEFGKRQERRLRRRTREEILNTDARDLDDQQIPASTIIQMASIRELLSDALKFTEKRCFMLNKLETITGAKRSHATFREGLCILDLLAVESQWLRRPPLHFERARELVADFAAEVVCTAHVRTSTRANAIIVLRTASKARFGRHFSRVLEAVLNGPESLQQQLLYAVFTYIARPYHESTKMLVPIREGLMSVQRRLAEGTLHLALNVIETIDRLANRIELKYATAEYRDLTPVQAWMKLRNKFGEGYRRHGVVSESLVRMNPGRDSVRIDQLIYNGEQFTLQDEHVLAWLSALNVEWLTCQHFLDLEVLPFLVHIDHILHSEDGQSILGQETSERLAAILHDSRKHSIGFAESRFADLVSQISAKPSLVLIRDNWDFFRREFRWISEALLQPRTEARLEGTPVTKDSRLIEMLNSAPAQLEQAMRDAYMQLKDKLPSRSASVQVENVAKGKTIVFCTEKLLRDAFFEFFHNLLKHKAASTVEIWIYIEKKDDGFIEVVMRNNGTKSKPEAGNGLRRLQNRLRYFDGDLTFTSRPEIPDITFEVKLTVREII